MIEKVLTQERGGLVFKYYARLEASSGWSYVLQARGHDWTLTKDGKELLDIGVRYYEHDGGTVNVRLPDGSHLYVPQQSTASVSGDVPALVSPRGVKKSDLDIVAWRLGDTPYIIDGQRL